MTQKKSAFSLIELMVVIAIVGLLAAIAFPLYSQYQVRGQVGEALTILRKVADDSLNTLNRTGSWPGGCPTTVPIPTTGTPLNQVVTCNGCGSYTTTPCLQVMGIFKTGVIPASNGGLAATTNNGNSITLAVFTNINGATKMFCGTDSRATLNTPTAYLPGGCIANFYDGTNWISGIPQ